MPFGWSSGVGVEVCPASPVTDGASPPTGLRQVSDRWRVQRRVGSPGVEGRDRATGGPSHGTGGRIRGGRRVEPAVGSRSLPGSSAKGGFDSRGAGAFPALRRCPARRGIAIAPETDPIHSPRKPDSTPHGPESLGGAVRGVFAAVGTRLSVGAGVGVVEWCRPRGIRRGWHPVECRGWGWVVEWCRSRCRHRVRRLTWKIESDVRKDCDSPTRAAPSSSDATPNAGLTPTPEPTERPT